jgi:hypothetical protein
MTVTVDLIDSGAFDLLQDMERRNLIRVNPAEQTAPAPHSTTRIGFLKGRVSVQADFATMGQEEITALFGENS